MPKGGRSGGDVEVNAKIGALLALYSLPEFGFFALVVDEQSEPVSAPLNPVKQFLISDDVVRCFSDTGYERLCPCGFAGDEKTKDDGILNRAYLGDVNDVTAFGRAEKGFELLV